MTEVVHDIKGEWIAAGHDDPIKAVRKFKRDMKWWGRKVRFQIWLGTVWNAIRGREHGG